MRRLFFFPRFFALWLTLWLALPNPAYALRAEQRESQAGAEELRRVFSVSGPAVPSIAAGAEEGRTGILGMADYLREQNPWSVAVYKRRAGSREEKFLQASYRGEESLAQHGNSWIRWFATVVREKGNQGEGLSAAPQSYLRSVLDSADLNILIPAGIQVPPGSTHLKIVLLYPAAGAEEGASMAQGLAGFLGGLTASQRKVWDYLAGLPGTMVEFTETGPDGEERRYALPALGLPASAVRTQVRLLGQNPRTLDSHWRHLTGRAGELVELVEVNEEGEEERYALPALGLPASAVRKAVSLLGMNPRTVDSHWRHLTGRTGDLVELVEVNEEGKEEKYTLPVKGLSAPAVRKAVWLLGLNPRTVDSHWRHLTGRAGDLVELVEGKEERYTLPALGLSAPAVRTQVQLLGRNPRTVDSHWRHLTGRAGDLVELVEVDEETKKEEKYTLPALGLSASAVRKAVWLLGLNPRTVDSHWRHLTGRAGDLVELVEGKEERYTLPALGLWASAVRTHVQLLGRNPRTVGQVFRYLAGRWPRLVPVLRETPTYLAYSLWHRYLPRIFYLGILKARLKARGMSPRKEFDLERIHAPLVESGSNFRKRVLKASGSVKVSDWVRGGVSEGAFQLGWPLLLAIHREVREEGVSWNTDWPARLRKELERGERHRSWADPAGKSGEVYRLLTDRGYGWVRKELFDGRGRLKDPLYRLEIPFPEFPGAMEDAEEEGAAPSSAGAEEMAAPAVPRSRSVLQPGEIEALVRGVRRTAREQSRIAVLIAPDSLRPWEASLDLFDFETALIGMGGAMRETLHLPAGVDFRLDLLTPENLKTYKGFRIVRVERDARSAERGLRLALGAVPLAVARALASGEDLYRVDVASLEVGGRSWESVARDLEVLFAA